MYIYMYNDLEMCEAHVHVYNACGLMLLVNVSIEMSFYPLFSWWIRQ